MTRFLRSIPITITGKCDLVEDMILWISGWWGLNTGSDTHKGDDTTVYFNTRRRKKMRLQRNNTCFIIRMIYIEVCISLDSRLWYSQALYLTYLFPMNIRLAFLSSFFWFGLQDPIAYSLWGGVVPSPSIG